MIDKHMSWYPWNIMDSYHMLTFKISKQTDIKCLESIKFKGNILPLFRYIPKPSQNWDLGVNLHRGYGCLSDSEVYLMKGQHVQQKKKKEQKKNNDDMDHCMHIRRITFKVILLKYLIFGCLER